MVDFPLHIQWLIQNFANDIESTLHKQNARTGVQAAFETMMRADPTPRKNLVDWMVRGLAREPAAFLWEDLRAGEKSKVSDTLKSWVFFASLLPREARNINQYSRLGDIAKALQPLVEAADNKKPLVGGKEAKRKERMQALEQSHVIWRDERCVVAVPLTRKAAEWWGRGTQWCTAATKSENFFDYYNSKSPLFVVILDGKKYQIHASAETELQVMNEFDTEVPQPEIWKNWQYFRPIMQYLLGKDGSTIRWFPQQEHGPELYWQAIDGSGFALGCIPREDRTPEICRRALEQTDEVIDEVPLEYLTQDMVDGVKHWNSFSIQYVPPEMMGEEKYLQLVREQPVFLIDMPTKALTPNIIKEAFLLVDGIDKTTSSALAYGFLKTGYAVECLDNQILCLMAKNIDTSLLVQHGINLFQNFIKRIVDAKLLSEDLFKILAEKNSTLLFNILDRSPDQHETLLMAKIHSLANYTLENSPKEFLTKELYLAAVSSDSSLIEEVPEEWLDAEMYNSYVSAHYGIPDLDNIPNRFKTKNLFMLAVKRNGLKISHIPIQFWDRELIEHAVIENGWALSFIYSQHLSPEIRDIERKEGLDWHLLSLHASKTTSRLLEFLPEHLVTKEICFNALKIYSGWNIWEKISESLVTVDFLTSLIKDTKNFPIENIPEKYWNDRICKVVADIFWSDDNYISQRTFSSLPPKVMDEIMDYSPYSGSKVKHEIAWKIEDLEPVQNEFEQVLNLDENDEISHLHP